MTSTPTPYVLDLSEETRHFEVAVFCYLFGQDQEDPGQHDPGRCTYSVDADRGHGRVSMLDLGSDGEFTVVYPDGDGDSDHGAT